MATIKYPKHCNGAVNAGEERLLKYLEVTLPGDYYIIPNAEYANASPRGSVQYLEYDCLVVTPHGIYNIENKDWAGHLEGDDSAWFINDTERANPHKTVRFKTSVLASQLKSKNPAWGGAWIAGAVTLSNPRQNKFGLDPNSGCYKTTFLLDHNLIEYITNSSVVNKSPDAIAHVYKGIVEFLIGESSERSQKEKTEVINLKIIETLQRTPIFTEYLCEPKLFPERRFKVREYPLDPAGMSPSELNSYQSKVQNAQLAQDILPSSSYIIKAECRLSDDGLRYYEKSDYLDENTLRAELRRSTFTEHDKIRVLLNLASALEIAHEKSVYHRDINPDNIYLLNGHAALANFSMAWFVQHKDLNYTVAESDIVSTPYQPAELFDKDVSKATDTYSLGVIAYELMTGKEPFGNYIDLARLGGTIPADKLPSKINPNIPAWVDELCDRTIREKEEERWDNISEIKEFIFKKNFETQSSKESSSTNTKDKLKDLLPGDSITSELVLYEELGEGGFAKVFRAKHSMMNKYFALKIFAEDLTERSVIDEYKALEEIDHPHVVKFKYNGISNGGMFYTLMELLEGENVRKYTGGDLRLPLQKIYQMTKEVLSALVYMQNKSKPIYHRDIKPNNIVWDKGERFVLIDFNIATDSKNDKAMIGTYPYLAPDLIHKGNKVNWDASADTFALGVTLYELLTHQHPWTGSKMPTLDKKPTEVSKHNYQVSDAFAALVMKAIKTQSADRFADAKQMQNALLEIGEKELYKTAPVTIIDPYGEEISMVDYINSLYSQSSYGNAGTRAGLKETLYDKETYTATKLDKKLLESIKDGKYKLVIITGNAGDGKTAFIRRVESVASNVERLTNRNGARFRISDIPFQSNYDGSQDEEGMANNDVLTDFFKPFEGKSNFLEANEGRIIAINEGRLVDFLQTSSEHKQLANIIEEYFYQEGYYELPKGLMIINLNLRSVTACDGLGDSLLRSQIKKLTNKELWWKCEHCQHAKKCFIKYNLDTFTDSAVGGEVTNRLEWLIRTIVYKRELHITIRDLRSLIAYMLTRDHSCQDIDALIQAVDAGVYSKEYYWQFYYFNLTAPSSFLGKSYKELESNDRIIKMLRETDIAQVSIPALDRDLYFKNKRDNDYLDFADRQNSLIEEFDKTEIIEPAYEQDANKQALLKNRHQSFIRYHYFEGKSDFKKRLPYQSLEKFYLELNQETRSLEVTKQSLAHAISCSEGCWEADLSQNYLLLSSSHVNDPLSKSYRRFSLEEFELFVKRNDDLVEYIEHENDCFVFRHKIDKHIQLTISLDLYEMLYHIQKGFSPSINDLRGKFIDLQVFKNLLESKTYTEVLVTKNNRKFHIISLDPVTKNIKIEPLNRNCV